MYRHRGQYFAGAAASRRAAPLLARHHAILHEAALTFLGVGLDPSQPAIGVLLADAMRYLSGGYWWLGVFPGLGLLLMVLAIQRLATQLRQAL